MSGIIQGNTRFQMHSLTDTGEVFTVPPSEDFTDRTWVPSDLVLGEIGLNLTDDRAFFRSSNGIVELQTSSITSGLWVRVGEDIVAVENGITSPLIYPNILPPVDDASDLGSSSFRWKDLYLVGVVDYASDLDFQNGANVKARFGTSSVRLASDDVDAPAQTSLSLNAVGAELGYVSNFFLTNNATGDTKMNVTATSIVMANDNTSAPAQGAMTLSALGSTFTHIDNSFTVNASGFSFLDNGLGDTLGNIVDGEFSFYADGLMSASTASISGNATQLNMGFADWRWVATATRLALVDNGIGDDAVTVMTGSISMSTDGTTSGAEQVLLMNNVTVGAKPVPGAILGNYLDTGRVYIENIQTGSNVSLVLSNNSDLDAFADNITLQGQTHDYALLLDSAGLAVVDNNLGDNLASFADGSILISTDGVGVLAESFLTMTSTLTTLGSANEVLVVAPDGIKLRTQGTTYDGSELIITQAAVQTTDGTITTILNIPLSNGEMITVEARVNGQSSTASEVCGAQGFAVFSKQGGVITQTGSTDVNLKSTTISRIMIDSDGTTNVRVRVIGIAATTMNWVACLNYHKTITNA